MKQINLENKIQKIPLQKKDTILVWLDFGPYSYINLGIVSELSKLGKFDFIGIVTTEQDMDFIKKQNFVQFKKLFYYPESYIGKSSYDINNIKKIEEKFGLNLWLDIFSERSFYKYWTNFHKFTREEIFVIIENSLLFFINVIEEYNPKIILMQQAGENISNLLLYRIAKKMNIEILMPNNLHLRNKIHISNNLTSDEIADEFDRLKSNFIGSYKKYDKEFLTKIDHSITLKTVASFDSSISTFPQKINHYFKRLSNELEPIYKNTGKTKLNLIKNRIYNYFEVKTRGRFLENYSIKTIGNDKFLYFPLQSEPEATILALSPFYSNQISLIETIAKAIPIDFLLYVKEHPIQKEKSWRPIKDYKKIINIPNVRLLHPSIESLKIVEKSQGVISISGSTGFEGIFFQKPVILFGDEHYDRLSMVTKIKTMNDLPKKIKNALTNFKFNERELNIFMEILNKNSLSIPYSLMMKDGVSLSSVQKNGRNFNLTNSHFQKFVNKYEKEFKLIAKTILSRYFKIGQ